MDRENLLGKSNVFQLIVKFSGPAIVGMLVNALYNIVDRIYIGQKLGQPGIAGIAVSFPIVLIVMAFGMLIGFGSTSLLSIRLGEKKHDECRIITGNAFSALIFVGLVLSATGLLFMEPLLLLFGASQAVLPFASDYTFIILCGIVFQMIGFGLNNQIRALGKPKTAMLTMVVGASINIILDPIFIFIFNWDMKGAALATVISQVSSAVWVSYYLLSKENDLAPHSSDFNISSSLMVKMISYGVPPFLMQIASSVLTIVLMNKLQELGGVLAVSSMGIALSVNNFILMPVFGLNQGVAPIVGYNYGAGNLRRVTSALKNGVIIATCFVTIGWTVIMLAPEILARMFNNNDLDLVSYASKVIQVNMFMLPVIGFQVIASGFFQAIGKPNRSSALTILRQAVIYIPLIFILSKAFGLPGVFYAGPIADLVAAIFSSAFLISELKRFRQEPISEINAVTDKI